MPDKAFTLLEDTFEDYLLKKINKAKFEKDIALALRALPLEGPSKTFAVSVINEDHKTPFFGLYVYPVVDELDKMAAAMVNNAVSFSDLCKRWSQIDDWYIEIDAICFDRSIINFSPKELTAMILHEIGHVIYSDRTVERWYRAYQDAKVRVKLTDRPSLKVLYSLYSIPLAVSCIQKNWVDSKNRISVEYAADKVITRYGYGDAMVSALDKIIKVSGSINQTERTKIGAVQSSIDWCNVNSLDLTRRKNKLKDEIFYQGLRTNSGYFKALGLSVLNKMGVGLKEKYTGEACEMTIDKMYDNELYVKYIVAIESDAAFALDRKAQLLKSSGETQWSSALEGFGRKKPIKLPSQYDIDCIEIEIDKITNHYDRTYVLDLIYKVLDDIELFEDSIASDSSKSATYAPKIAQMRKTLDGYRMRCLAKKNLDKQYKFFVKYPEGYEG